MRAIASSFLLWTVVGTALVACHQNDMTSAPSQGNPIASGDWGGDQARLVVTSDGAELELPCAHGRIGEPLIVPASGRFEWKGTFVQERGGPTPEGGDPAAAAVYSGAIDGETLVLSVRAGSTLALDAVRFTRGRAVRIVKCA
jgi:hypothetical protein